MMADEDPSWMKPSSPAFWEEFEAEAETSTIYDPPQFKPGWNPNPIVCSCLNWWQQRSPLCAVPPCSCVSCIYGTCVQGSEYLNMLEPDEWMVKFLSSVHPNCPEDMKGLYWMCDNTFPHEHLMTYQDAVWASNGKVAMKSYKYNWTRGSTMFGSIMFAMMNRGNKEQRMEISPDGKWCMMNRDHQSKPMWFWSPTPGTKFKTPYDGGEFESEPGEKIRVTYNDKSDPKSGLYYQYRLRRIAYLDPEGKLVKTPAYDDLRKRINMTQENAKPCCGGYFVCASKDERALGNLPYLPVTTVVKFAPGHQ